jgi:hypothetical protein
VASAPLYTTFDGEAVGVNDVLIKYTWFGDADLDGKVSTNDYFQIDAGFLNGRSGWINGDFDYSGGVTTNDYFLIDNAFLGQNGVILGPASAGGQVTAVPEPLGGVAVVGLLSAASLGRRGRKR